MLFIHSCLELDLHSPHPRGTIRRKRSSLHHVDCGSREITEKALDWFVGKDIVASLRLVVIDEVNFPPKLFPSMDE